MIDITPKTPPDTPPDKASPAAPPPRRPHRTPTARRASLGLALLVAAGIGAGATAFAERGHQQVFVPLSPAPIASMKDWSPVAIKGQVAEIYGNKFVLADDSGRALVDTGRQGEGGHLVAPSETVTVQGRFENGSVHALALQHGEGKTVLLGPPDPPPPPGPLAGLDDPGPHGWFARHF